MALPARDELSNFVKTLQGEKRVLAFGVDCLRAEKGRLEAAI
jgi:hypothetical protein